MKFKTIFFYLFFVIIPFAAGAQKDTIIVPGKIDNSDNRIFDKVDIEASFPGGDDMWRKFLEKNVNGSVAVDNGAPIGIYTVIVQFVVSKDGSISDVEALTSLGFGMEQEVVKVIQHGPKWVPASQNGRMVRAYRRQPVTFQVEDEDINVTTKERYTLNNGIDNPVTIKVEKMKDDDLEFVISQGSIVRRSEGNYTIRVKSTGRVTLEIYNKKKKKNIGAVSFVVK